MIRPDEMSGMHILITALAIPRRGRLLSSRHAQLALTHLWMLAQATAIGAGMWLSFWSENAGPGSAPPQAYFVAFVGGRCLWPSRRASSPAYGIGRDPRSPGAEPPAASASSRSVKNVSFFEPGFDAARWRRSGSAFGSNSMRATASPLRPT